MPMETVRRSPMFRYLMVLTVASTVGLQAWRTLFDNFAVHVAGLGGGHVGVIQSVREIPGLLTFLVVYVLFLLREHRLSALSILLLGAGVGLTGLFPSYAGLLATTLLMSLGFHYYETTNQSLTLQYFDRDASPWVFGKQRSAAAAANIGVGGAIFLLAAVLEYREIYLLVAAVLAGAAAWAFAQDPSDGTLVPQHRRMIFRRRYGLFYFLTFMAGARRQIFIAFAVFLLVQRFHFTVQEITLLFLANNVVNFFLSPRIGRAIIRFGERKVLTLEYASLVLIFLAYAAVESRAAAAALYILDHIFFNFAIAIRTYFQKVADPADIAPSMAVSFAINHIAAVALPALGGLLWLVDYRIPFLAGAALAAGSLAAVQWIRTPAGPPAGVKPPGVSP
jgi:hypothetical protein